MRAVKQSEMYNSTLLLLIYILMNTVKNYPTIHLRLNWIDMLEVVILLMTYLIKYVFQIKLSMFNMIKGINESKTLTKHISCECKCKFDRRKCKSNQKRNNDKC